MRPSALKARSASQAGQGNAKCMPSKHVNLGSKLAKIRFSANTFKIALGVGLFKQFFFKENVRYPVWTCREPMIIFSESRDPNRDPKTPLKNPGLNHCLPKIAGFCCASVPRYIVFLKSHTAEMVFLTAVQFKTDSSRVAIFKSSIPYISENVVLYYVSA